MIDLEPRARFELALARYNVAAPPHELLSAWTGRRATIRTAAWKASTLSGFRDSQVRHAREVWLPAARVERTSSHVAGERSCPVLSYDDFVKGPGGRIRTCNAPIESAARSERGASTCFAAPAKGSPVSDADRQSPE